MKETGILFKTEMVRATLAGLKTQTRRIVKPQPESHNWEILPDYKLTVGGPYKDHSGRMAVRFQHTIKFHAEEPVWALCPYGGPGDRLYVRETWRTLESLYQIKPSKIIPGAPVEYAAGGNNVFGWENRRLPGMSKWRPSIFMPKWASRIIRQIVSVRVERLQDITEEDAIAEGCSPDGRAEGTLYRGPIHPVKGTYKVYPCAKAAYKALWESINGPGSWELNPYVWVIEFKEVQP